MKKRKKNRREKGQAMLEFAFVLPIFILLVMGIIDFGWLFYNYISVSNSARNAARIACVEYEHCAYDEDSGQPKYDIVYSLNLGDLNEGLPDDKKMYTDNEVRLADTISNSLKGTAVKSEDTSFTVTYTYDEEMKHNIADYKVGDRYKGDVVVSVSSKVKVLTPVLGVFSDNMMYDIGAKSTFKVEKQYKPDVNPNP